MSEVAHVFTPEAGTFLASIAGPQLTVMTGSSHPVPAALFDSAAPETIFFPFRAVRYPGAREVLVDVTWAAVGTPTGAVVWGASLLAVTPEIDSANVLTGETFAAEQTVIDPNLGSAPFRLMRATIAIPVAQVDALAADDFAILKLRRVADNAADTMNVDAAVVEVALRYQDA